MSFWFTGDEEPDDQRFRDAGLAACGLYQMAGAACMGKVRNQRTPLPARWFVPDHLVRSWPNGARSAARLVRVGLWERTDGGYFYVWIRKQNTPEALRANRAKELRKWERKQTRKRATELPAVRPHLRGIAGGF